MPSSNYTETQVVTDTLIYSPISQFKQTVVEFNKLIENVSSSVQADLNTVFLEIFPDVDGHYQSRVIEKSVERVKI